jgi:sec-independent protein translocase protein TatC
MKKKTKQQESALQDDTEQPLIYHLIELRDRLLRVVLVVGVVFLVLFPFSNKLFSWLSGPLMAHMPEGSSMIAIEVASPFRPVQA